MGNNEYDPYAKHDSVNDAEPFIPEYAGFWIRFIAYIIDSIALGIITVIIMIPMFFVMAMMIPTSTRYSGYSSYNSGAYSAFICVYCLTIIVVLVVQWLYYALFESSKYQGTPGKILLGLAVVDENGDRISFGKATLRYVSKLITNVILALGYIAIAFSSKKQGLYDMIARTYVIKK